MSWDVSLEGLAILIVDDDDDARELTAVTLEMAGARVSTAASTSEALELLGHEWDVVVTDIGMPRLSGYDLIRAARQRGHRVPMIALTGFGTPEHRRQALVSGFACHLTKPLLPERLIAAVSQTVRTPAVPQSSGVRRAVPCPSAEPCDGAAAAVPVARSQLKWPH